VSAGQAPVSLIDVRDIASVAAHVLSEPTHEGKTYDLTGPQALTHTDIADRLSQATNTQITYRDIPPEAMRKGLVDFGMPAWQADGLVEDYAHYRRGEAAEVTATVREITGSEPRTFSSFALESAALFRA
jgi:uncharacterized protein YbjT (DUF2867 family)